MQGNILRERRLDVSPRGASSRAAAITVMGQDTSIGPSGLNGDPGGLEGGGSSTAMLVKKLLLSKSTATARAPTTW